MGTKAIRLPAIVLWTRSRTLTRSTVSGTPALAGWSFVAPAAVFLLLSLPDEQPPRTMSAIASAMAQSFLTGDSFASVVGRGRLRAVRDLPTWPFPRRGDGARRRRRRR